MLHAVEVVHDFGMGLPFALGGLLLVGVEVVDAAYAAQIIKRECRVVAQVAADFDKAVWCDLDPRVNVLQVRARDFRAELGFQLVKKCSASHLSITKVLLTYARDGAMPTRLIDLVPMPAAWADAGPVGRVHA